MLVQVIRSRVRGDLDKVYSLGGARGRQELDDATRCSARRNARTRVPETWRVTHLPRRARASNDFAETASTKSTTKPQTTEAAGSSSSISAAWSRKCCIRSSLVRAAAEGVHRRKRVIDRRRRQQIDLERNSAAGKPRPGGGSRVGESRGSLGIAPTHDEVVVLDVVSKRGSPSRSRNSADVWRSKLFSRRNWPSSSSLARR